MEQRQLLFIIGRGVWSGVQFCRVKGGWLIQVFFEILEGLCFRSGDYVLVLKVDLDRRILIIYKVSFGMISEYFNIFQRR